jgi:hypothetical protein
MAEPKLLIVHETVAQSIIKDAVSAFTLLSMVGVGIWVDSSALQWVAGLLWVLWMLGKSINMSNRNVVHSFSAARKKLDAWEAGE